MEQGSGGEGRERGVVEMVGKRRTAVGFEERWERDK